jgi:hypothetical protein
MTLPQQSILEIFDEINSQFARARLERNTENDDSFMERNAESKSIAYIQSFWPHVANAISADPTKLGLSVVGTFQNKTQRLDADTLKQNFIDHPDHQSDPVTAARIGGILSSSAMMQQVLNYAVSTWIKDFDTTPPRCPYPFDLAADDFVSLRMLIPLRKENSGHDNIGANAPSLVMGGTTTAITMCWNLLNEIPYAYKALTGTTPSRSMVESIWSDTRELIFRVGAGSLTAFVSFASALSSDPSAMVWEGCAKLSLTKEKERFVWTMDDELAKNITQIHKTISAHQGNEYYGCTALYAKTQPLPLNSQWADKVESNREQLVFSELIRWITAIARKQFFSTFD